MSKSGTEKSIQWLGHGVPTKWMFTRPVGASAVVTRMRARDLSPRGVTIHHLEFRAARKAKEPVFTEPMTICPKCQAWDENYPLSRLRELSQAQNQPVGKVCSNCHQMVPFADWVRYNIKVSDEGLADTIEHLSALFNMAQRITAEGSYRDAEKMLRDALASCERMLGDGPDAANIRTNLAQVLEAQGKYADAEQEWRFLLAFSERDADPGVSHEHG